MRANRNSNSTLTLIFSLLIMNCGGRDHVDRSSEYQELVDSSEYVIDQRNVIASQEEEIARLGVEKRNYEITVAELQVSIEQLEKYIAENRDLQEDQKAQKEKELQTALAEKKLAEDMQRELALRQAELEKQLAAAKASEIELAKQLAAIKAAAFDIPSAAQITITAQYTIIAQSNCLDIPNASLEQGVGIVPSLCNNGRSQTFKLEKVNDQSFRIIAQHSNKCLHIRGGLDALDTPVEQLN